MVSVARKIVILRVSLIVELWNKRVLFGVWNCEGVELFLGNTCYEQTKSWLKISGCPCVGQCDKCFAYIIWLTHNIQ